MGAGLVKVLENVYTGEMGRATSMMVLKNAKITAILTENEDESWKTDNINRVCLKLKDLFPTALKDNLREGASFIHASRSKREPVLVATAPKDNDAVAFIVSYAMMLTGISVDDVHKAVIAVVKCNPLKAEYLNALKEVQSASDAPILRSKLYIGTGMWPKESLDKDTAELRQLAGLPALPYPVLGATASASTPAARAQLTGNDHTGPPALSYTASATTPVPREKVSGNDYTRANSNSDAPSAQDTHRRHTLITIARPNTVEEVNGTTNTSIEERPTHRRSVVLTRTTNNSFDTQ